MSDTLPQEDLPEEDDDLLPPLPPRTSATPVQEPQEGYTQQHVQQESGQPQEDSAPPSPGDDRVLVGALRNVSEESLVSSSPTLSPRGRHPRKTKRPQKRYQDSDSCPSVSPSPDPDSRLRTFQFEVADIPQEGEGISEALQTEREFLDFMLSLPQVQKEGPGRPVIQEVAIPQHHEHRSPTRDPADEEAPLSPGIDGPAPIVQALPPVIGGGVQTRVGLDHLDNLCKMMEQLGDLKEQNTRLQRRVQYLEELRTLQEMHRHLQETLEARRSGLASIHLSESDLRRIDEDSFDASEESLLDITQRPHHKEQYLEPPESPVGRRHSSSEDERRTTIDRDDPSRSIIVDKEKKAHHRSAWGKVKNMISTRRDSVRKKSTGSSHRKSTGERPGLDIAGGISIDISAASDPEDYDVDYDAIEPMDPGGSMEDCDSDIGGVWIGPKEDVSPASTVSLGVRRAKPQLTITVPSSEDVSMMQAGKDGHHRRSAQRRAEAQKRKISPGQAECPASPALPVTPPSSRRTSNWTKVKKAFLTGQQHHPPHHHHHQHGHSSSLPPSPVKKNTFHFDGLGSEEDLYSPGVSPEVSPEVNSVDLRCQQQIIYEQETPPPHQNHSMDSSPIPQSLESGQLYLHPLDQGSPHSADGSTPSPHPPISPGHPLSQPGVPKNIADLQKSLSGEFSRRLQEWERLRPGAPGSMASSGSGTVTKSGRNASSVGGVQGSQSEDSLPYEFRKKLHEWEKIKKRDKGKVDMPRTVPQEDNKTKVHGEDDLPADFKKRLTEWEIGKALAGKNQQNVEELQLKLGEEFNRKMAEWERMKATGSQSQVNVAGSNPSPASPKLDRKGSAQKIKKNKGVKQDKVPVAKTEVNQKARDKELQWLEKELNKVERETNRLEREKEKFLERQSRLEKMRHAMSEREPEKKEIYIRTSTGEFRFEGISQTFTKKLYEWEERRGIRPESSTIALLDPNYNPPEKEVTDKPKSPEFGRLIRSKSESSVAAERVTATSLHSHPSTLSLNDVEIDDMHCLQGDNKAASEPTLVGDDSSSKCAVLVQMEDVEDLPHCQNTNKPDPYDPSEITRNIDSSGSEEDVTRRQRLDNNEDFLHPNLRHSKDGNQASYRSLLEENMTLLDKLRQQENMCRSLEHQMGDIDNKMDTVADQHLRTLEKLHRQVSIIIKDTSENDIEGSGKIVRDLADQESNERLINQLRARIVDLEGHGDQLLYEKEQLEKDFKLHKDQETEIAESLVLRIRELQDAGAVVNIQTVQCQTEDIPYQSDNKISEGQTEDVMCQSSESLGLLTQQDDLIDDQISLERLTPVEGTTENIIDEHPIIEEKIYINQEEKTKLESDIDIKNKMEERNLLTDSKKENDKVEDRMNISASENKAKDPKKSKKPPKKVQKLHNLTSDLLFQAKCLEQALVTKHGLDQQRGENIGQAAFSVSQRGLRGRSSLRIAGDGSVVQRRKQRASATRTWSSIEAITSPQGSSNSIFGNERGEDGSNHRRDPNQELLAMNAELSRMAKELRFEMNRMWSFRDSTSPESECSESRDERRTVDDLPDICHTETDKLVAEAREVFQSIASLQKEDSPPVDLPTYKTKTPSRTSSSSSKSSRRKESFGRRQRSIEEKNKRSMSPANKKMKNCKEDGPSHQEMMPLEYHQEISPLSMVLSSGSTLEEMLLRNQNESMIQKKGSERRRSSDAISTVTSGPSRSHSPSPSIASSPETERASFHYDDDVSLSGTWRTSATTSTLRSGEHMLSSSFEWEDEADNYTPRPRAKWKTLKEEEEEGEDYQGAHSKVSEWKYKEDDERRKYTTEVTKAKAKLGELRTRRISDTQVEYDGHHNKDECFAYTFGHTVYDDEALTVGRVSRNSSIRRGDSREAEDLRCRRSKTQPSFITESCLDNIKAADVFVKTKRTLFTVQGSSQGSDQARATPTFMQSQDEDAESPSESSNDRVDENVDNSNTDLFLKECQSESKDSINKTVEVTNISDTDLNIKTNSGEKLISVQDIKIENCSKDYIDDSESKEAVHNIDGNEINHERVNFQEKIPSSVSEEALDIMTALPVAGRSPCTSRQLSPSPSTESKRKVLEAANEGIPAIRNIIQMFNQRITENQELLSNPFRMQSPPTSPAWKSPRTGRKVFAGGFSSREDSEDRKTPQPTGFANPGSGVQKSYSSSVILPAPDLGHVQRSASSSVMEGRPREVNTTLPERCFPLGISQSAAASLWEMSPPSSPPLSPALTSADTSYDLDVSLDDSLLHEQRTSIASGIEKSPSGCLRAIKIKRAKEEFLARGGGFTAVSTDRLSRYDPIHFRQRSGTASTEESWRHSEEISTPMLSPTPVSSPLPSEENSQNVSDVREKMHRTSSKRRNIPNREESFRRQSAGCISDTKSSSPVLEVIKSSSSGVLIKNKKIPRFSSETDVQSNIKSSNNPSTESIKPARGIFKLFRRHKDKDQKDLNVVQRLCRQSLTVDGFASKNSSRSGSKSVTPQPDLKQQEALNVSLEGAESVDLSRSSKTLPRGHSEHTLASAPSRSCPSSPVAQRSRTSNWIARGKHMFKSRSPSPSKKTRPQR